MPRLPSNTRKTELPSAAATRVFLTRLVSRTAPFALPSIAFLISLMAGADPAMAQAPASGARPARPPTPTRDANTPGYVTAKNLPDEPRN